MTDTSYEPLTNFGIQWEELLLGAGEDMTARMPSSVRSRAHIDAVLATAEVTRAVVRGDAAAVLRMSGVATDASSLVELKERTIMKVLAKQALDARGLARGATGGGESACAAAYSRTSSYRRTRGRRGVVRF